MTDMTELLDLLTRFGVGFHVQWPGDPQHYIQPGPDSMVIVKEGMAKVDGYASFYASFQFDPAGRFVQVVVGE